MTILKKLLIAALMISSMPAVFGHSAIQLKRELVRIDEFTKELRTINSTEAHTLVAYLEDVLKNDADGWWGHRDEESRYVSDDEVLAIVRVLKANISFELKQSEVAKIMAEAFEKDAKIKAQRNREEWLHMAYTGGTVVALLAIPAILTVIAPIK